ncbi:MAG: HlyD family secretion protein, partial [Owenweeksia sp.]
MDKKIERKGFSRQRLIYIAAALLIAFLIGFVLLTGSRRSVRLDTSNLVIKTVSQAPFQEFISVDATILPRKTVIIDALISGKIIHKHVEDGALLSAGEPILELENIDLQLDILNRETAVLDLINNIRQTRINLGLNTANRQKERTDQQYQLREAARNYHMNKALWEDSVISRSEYEASLNQYNYTVKKARLLEEISGQDSLSAREQIKQMEASLRQSNKNLELMKTKLEDLVIRAPVAGQLTNFNLELGQLINTGENIGQIDVTSGFKIRAQVDQFYLNRMTIGQKASTTINGKDYQLSVSRVYPTVENSLFAVDLEFDKEQPSGITRGQNLVARIELSTRREA